MRGTQAVLCHCECSRHHPLGGDQCCTTSTHSRCAYSPHLQGLRVLLHLVHVTLQCTRRRTSSLAAAHGSLLPLLAPQWRWGQGPGTQAAHAAAVCKGTQVEAGRAHLPAADAPANGQGSLHHQALVDVGLRVVRVCVRAQEPATRAYARLIMNVSSAHVRTPALASGPTKCTPSQAAGLQLQAKPVQGHSLGAGS